MEQVAERTKTLVDGQAQNAQTLAQKNMSPVDLRPNLDAWGAAKKILHDPRAVNSVAPFERKPHSNLETVKEQVTSSKVAKQIEQEPIDRLVQRLKMSYGDTWEQISSLLRSSQLEDHSMIYVPELYSDLAILKKGLLETYNMDESFDFNNSAACDRLSNIISYDLSRLNKPCAFGITLSKLFIALMGNTDNFAQHLQAVKQYFIEEKRSRVPLTYFEPEHAIKPSSSVIHPKGTKPLHISGLPPSLTQQQTQEFSNNHRNLTTEALAAIIRKRAENKQNAHIPVVNAGKGR